jgi:malonate transporter and related proteins
MITVLLNSLVPIFAVMGLGYFAGRSGYVDNHHVLQLNVLVMDFALPASLFVATASTSRIELIEEWPLLVVLVVSMLALYALCYWMQRHLFGLGSIEASGQTPSGFLGVLFELRYGLDVPVAGSTLLVSSLASAVTLTIALVLTAGWS